MLETKVESQSDANPQETSEWMQSLDAVLEEGGSERATFLLARLIDHAAMYGIQTPHNLTTPYINTVPLEEEVPYPGDREIERRIKSLNRWNAMAMVVRANKYDPGIGGHISTYASLAMAGMAINPATLSTSKDMPRPEPTRGRIWKDASRKSIWKTSGTSCVPSPAFPHTRIPG
jgi:hypothetical protein